MATFITYPVTPAAPTGFPSRRCAQVTICRNVLARQRVFRIVDPEPSPSTRGGHDAFRRHVVRELAVLLRVAQRLTGNPADAEDLVQETLVRAYRAIDRFDGRHPRAWLLTIQRNTRRSMTRKTRPQLPSASADSPTVTAASSEGTENHVIDRVLDAEVAAEVAAELGNLSDNHRTIVALVDIDGLSYQEAAEVLGIPRGTVMSRLHRARTRLRAGLKRRGFDLTVGG